MKGSETEYKTVKIIVVWETVDHPPQYPITAMQTTIINEKNWRKIVFFCCFNQDMWYIY